jgi:FAD/FMN-containing dehydrogenase
VAERVVGGTIMYRGSEARDVLRTFRDVAAAAPADFSCQAVLSADESLAPTLLIAPCYTGDDGDPDQLRALREAPGLVSDDVRAWAFLDQQLVFDSTYGEDRHYWKGHFVRELPDELIDVLVARVVDFGRPPVHVLIESLHGTPKETDVRLGPVAYRQAAFNVSAMAVWADAEEDAQHIEWARSTAGAIEPWSLGGGYANYMQADEPIERVRAAFGDDAFQRLRALKSRYDPENVLRRNQNIPPSRESTEL